MAQRFNAEFNAPTPPEYNECIRHSIAGLDIVLMQHKTRRRGSFAVQYGKQVDHHLGYAQAAQNLGAAIMHALCLESDNLDNERD